MVVNEKEIPYTLKMYKLIAKIFSFQPPLNNTEDTVSIREKVKLSPSEKWRILKNVTILSSAFMVQFTAFQVSETIFSELLRLTSNANYT